MLARWKGWKSINAIFVGEASLSHNVHAPTETMITAVMAAIILLRIFI